MIAVFVPTPGTEGVEDNRIYYVEGPDAMTICKMVGIEDPEGVHGANARIHDFVAVVDDEGHRKGFRRNLLAAMINGYPGRMMGPALFFGEGFDGEGFDFISIPLSAKEWILQFCQADQLWALPAPVKARVEDPDKREPREELKFHSFVKMDDLIDFLDGH